MTDRSDKTHSPGDNTLANLYATEAELEVRLTQELTAATTTAFELRKVRAAIKRACGDSMAKL